MNISATPTPREKGVLTSLKDAESHPGSSSRGSSPRPQPAPPLEAPLREQLWLNLARAASAAGHGVEVGLRPYGLSPTQLNVLHILRDAGAEGLCQYQIGERLTAQVPDVPRILDRMERAGWVQRERGTIDRRLVMARLTESGLTLAANVDGIIDQLTSRMFSGLSAADISKLNELLTIAHDTAIALSAEQQNPAAHTLQSN